MRGDHRVWKGLLLVLVLGCAGCPGSEYSEIVTYCQESEGVYVIDKGTYQQTLLANLSGLGIDKASSLTFCTKQRYSTQFYLHANSIDPAYQDPPQRALFRVDISQPQSPSVEELGLCSKCGGGMAMCADGVLYSVYGRDYDHEPEGLSHLYIIDPVTLEHTHVGGLTEGGEGFFTGNLGLTCEPVTDRLYLFSRDMDALYIVDKETAEATQVGPANLNVQGGVGLQFDPKRPSDLYLSVDMAPYPDRSYELYMLDPYTGEARHLAPLPYGNKNLGARIVEIVE